MNRHFTNFINKILDNFIPPALRDSHWFMGLGMRMVLGPKYTYYMEFKEKLPYMDENEINSYYTILADTFIKRKTDLNEKSIEKILQNLSGARILDAAAGKGYLAEKIKEKNPEKEVVALDIVLHDEIDKAITCVQGTLTDLPFADKAFDTVICTHALEHIKDVKTAVSELRRICKQRLIVVVPRQREYKYTFDLHINFFPYKYNVEALFEKRGKLCLVDNDWLYIEELN